MAKKYYVQDTRTYVGNSMTWWKHDDFGYVCDIREARIFTEDEAKLICTKKHTNKRMWPKDYIDARVEHHIDTQHCNHQQSLKDQQ